MTQAATSDVIPKRGGGIVIVGGSLSGLALALACAHRGIRACVLERAAGQHQGGGALAVDRALLMRVTGLDSCVKSGIPSFPVLTDFRRAVSWSAIYTWLRDIASGRPEIRLMTGHSVFQVVQNDFSATAITTEGQRFEAAVIAGADGYRSVVRRAVNPERPDGEYAGYVLWRGLVRESELPSETPWPRSHEGVALRNTAGHRLVAHPVAGQTGSLRPGERRISFAWYDLTRDAVLRELRCLAGTGQILGSLTCEQIPRWLSDELRDQASRIWPDPWRIAILHAFDRREVFATPVTEYFPERLVCGRLAIIGDAAHVVSPVTGRGFAAGVSDAEVLADCLGECFEQPGCNTILTLRRYEEKRLRDVQRLVMASIKWSRAFTRTDHQRVIRRSDDPT